MQAKVSMVIPCYNKQKWIRSLFDSIIVQQWDNIELIIINDGSTDKTRDIIFEYEKKLVLRGYEVNIIDQENQGVAAAVRNGLMMVTGDYVCQIDADDELDSRYVSLMAGWLEEHPDYDWAICDYNIVKDNSVSRSTIFPDGNVGNFNIENIIHSVDTAVWVIMVRSSYMKSCNVVESFYISRDANQEPQFTFPLVLGNGKLKHINEPLVFYNLRRDDTRRSKRDSYEKSKKRWNSIIAAQNSIFQSAPLDSNNKLRLQAISELEYNSRIIYDADICNFTSQNLSDAVEHMINLAGKYFKPCKEINVQKVHNNYMHFCTAVKDNITGNRLLDIKIPQGRIIAWGVLGRLGTALFPLLKDTELMPDELWDAAGDGIRTKKPDTEGLTENDLVLILTLWSMSIKDMISATRCNNVVFINDIRTYLAAKVFPEFYDGTISFIYPKHQES